MCYLLCLHTRYSCRHEILTRRQKIDCNGHKCSVSRNHIEEVHDCLESCALR
ncbi:hypothetical protein P691DRAFT_647715, partial [Macrolepiota fuliginosa MF-IS2]